MQTFSHMQRSGYDVRSLTLLLLLLYEPLTSIWPFFPLLLGVGAWHFFIASRRLERIFWIFYFYLFEVDHNLAFLMPLLALALHFFILKELARYFACEGCLMMVGVILFYALFGAVALFYREIFDIDFSISFFELLRYIAMDLVIVYAF